MPIVRVTKAFSNETVEIIWTRHRDGKYEEIVERHTCPPNSVWVARLAANVPEEEASQR